LVWPKSDNKKKSEGKEERKIKRREGGGGEKEVTVKVEKEGSTQGVGKVLFLSRISLRVSSTPL
jgi:hypothetical protein